MVFKKQRPSQQGRHRVQQAQRPALRAQQPTRSRAGGPARQSQGPTYYRVAGEGRLTAPSNHSSHRRARPVEGKAETARAARLRLLDDVARVSADYATTPGAHRRAEAPAAPTAAERALQDSRRRRARVARIAIAAAAVAVLMAIGVSAFVLRDDAVMDIEGSAFTYIVGQRVDLGEPVSLERRDSSWVADGQGSSLTLDGHPLYLDATGETMFGGRAMVVLPARQGAIRKVPPRTRAKYTEGICVLTSNEGDSEPIESGFVYDGADTYTLLSDARLVTDAGECLLPALSSIEATYGGAVYAYDYGTGSLQAFESGSAVLMVDDGIMTYEVNLMNDSMSCDGTDQLLLSSAASMPSIFE